MAKRLARGDPGVNPLDASCKEHDLAYASHSSSSERDLADKKLQKDAWKRVFASDASLGERATAIGVAAAMKLKRKLTKSGAGITSKASTKRKTTKQVSLKKLIDHARATIKKSKPETIDSMIKLAVASVNKIKKGKRVNTPRTIKLPTYSGGILPLIPIFAGLSALGSVASSAAGIYRAINRVRGAEKQFEENKRHNAKMEAIAIDHEKTGNGFYLKPDMIGEGFYLAPYTKKN